MRKIYGLGETILDIIFDKDQPITAKAGGSTFNTIISLARLGNRTEFISEIAKDKVGSIVKNFLITNNVGITYFNEYNNGQTPISLAFLDKDGNAKYDFYKNYSIERFKNVSPNITENDLLIFGSYYAINPLIREELQQIVKKAKMEKAVVIYDPNFRSSHLKDKNALFSSIMENFSLAKLIRGSDEDFKNIFGCRQINDIFNKINNFAATLIITSKEKVIVKNKNIEIKIPVKKIIPISTIGAGDTFNAGVVHEINKSFYLKDIDTISEEKWTEIIHFSIDLAQKVCMSYENYTNVNFLHKQFNL